MLKQKEGQHEPILAPDLPIVDSHHHLLDRPGMRYLVDEFLEDARAGHRIVASVFCEARSMERADGPELLRPLGEVEFANGSAAYSATGRYGDCRAAAAIVGFADLRAGEAIAELLDRALSSAPDRFRGIRQLILSDESGLSARYIPNPPPPGLIHHPGFRGGLRQLASRGLTFDAAVFHHQLGDLADLADEVPDLTFVLDHAGLALAIDKTAEGRAAIFQDWRAGMHLLAKRPNVRCKIGGFGLPFWGFGFDERAKPASYLDLADVWRPYVETAIEAFGAIRCMMESNYPPDARSCGYVPLWNALKHITRGCSMDERASLFHRTATQVYRIALNEENEA